MKHPIKQHLYNYNIHHEETIGSAFIWWIKRRNKCCRDFCPLCKYYYRCQEDIHVWEEIANVRDRHK